MRKFCKKIFLVVVVLVKRFEHEKGTPLSYQGERISLQIEDKPLFLACADTSKIKFSANQNEVVSKWILTPITDGDEKDENGMNSEKLQAKFKMSTNGRFLF